MNTELDIEPLPRSDWPELADPLSGDGRPHHDIDAEDCLFFRVHDGDCTLGFAGLQGRAAIVCCDRSAGQKAMYGAVRNATVPSADS